MCEKARKLIGGSCCADLGAGLPAKAPGRGSALGGKEPAWLGQVTKVKWRWEPWGEGGATLGLQFRDIKVSGGREGDRLGGGCHVCGHHRVTVLAWHPLLALGTAP